MTESATVTATERANAVAGGRGLAAWIQLTKPRQTGLLMATGVGAYLMAVPAPVSWTPFVPGVLGTAAAVSGATVLNMVLDRDIDARMTRTAARPLPTGQLTAGAALAFGLALAIGGAALSWWLDALFGLVITLGLVFDVVIYTMWLKRRTPFSILIGGISGGMPALAGRVLATGTIDVVGLLLATGVVLWIPAHILTLAMRHASEYEGANVPVWPSVYGERGTRRLIAGATLGAVTVLATAGVLAGSGPVALVGLAVAGTIMIVLAAASLARPSAGKDLVLFKAASIYMLVAFVCLTAGPILGFSGR
jgi:protoheme IX farnesyltransferase